MPAPTPRTAWASPPNAMTGAAMRLHATLNSSVGFAGRQLKLKNIKIDKMVLLGGGSNLPGLDEHLAKLFDVEVVAPDIHDALGEPKGHALDEVPGGCPSMQPAPFSQAGADKTVGSAGNMVSHLRECP